MKRDKGNESEDMSSVNLRRSMVGAAIMAKVAIEVGVPLRALFRGADLKPEDLEDANSTITFEQEFRLIRNLLARCGDDVGIGMKIGCRYRFTSLAPAGFALVSSPNYRSAFDIMLRYADLNASIVQVCLEEAKGSDLHIGFIEERLPEDIRHFAVERTMGVALA
ncbi:AraC family transcriptional regulator ligand-binding domain-containing protein, partial [Dyella sp. EPa41]|uniref:AraC family transcriptional regulator ligand-binding domain-containing protein n=1 Tax=Dyella sp. EPa41 TaxID=1561194 RepID=UPI00191539E9